MAFFLGLSLNAHSQKLENIRFENHREGVYQIIYDINNAKEDEKFKVNLKIKDSKGKVIPIKHIDGSIHDWYSGGKNKSILWDAKKDDLMLNDNIEIVLTAQKEFKFPFKQHLLKSVIFPGWGEYRMYNKKHYAYLGVVAYGGMIGSFFLNQDARYFYDQYLNSYDINESKRLYDNARFGKSMSKISFGIGAAAWVYGIYRVLRKSNKLKEDLTPEKSKYYFNHEQESFPSVAYKTKFDNRPEFFKFYELALKDFELSNYVEADKNLNKAFALESDFQKGRILRQNINDKLNDCSEAHFKLTEDYAEGVSYLRQGEETLALSSFENVKNNYWKLCKHNLQAIPRVELDAYLTQVRSSVQLKKDNAKLNAKADKLFANSNSTKQLSKVPILSLKEGSLSFHDNDGNGRLDANESAEIHFSITNNGSGTGRGLKLYMSSDQTQGLVFKESIPVSEINVGEVLEVIVPLKANSLLRDGKAVINMKVIEPNGMNSDPFAIEFDILSFKAPELIVSDYQFSSKEGGELVKKQFAYLDVSVQNIGQGVAHGVTCEFDLPKRISHINDTLFNVGDLNVGDYKKVRLEFVITDGYMDDTVIIRSTVGDQHFKFVKSNLCLAVLNQKLESTIVSIKGEEFEKKKIDKISLKSDVDINIPINKNKNENRFALVIGNEDYKKYQSTLNNEANVAYARRDAKVFAEYLTSTLGFPDDQVIVVEDGTRGIINVEIEKLIKLAKTKGNAEIVFYYAGHGYPDASNENEPYLVPVDVNVSNLRNDGISLNKLYNQLNSVEADRVTVFVDACFSGAGRDQGLLAARGVKVKPKPQVIRGNMVVISSSTGKQQSYPNPEESHGLFTYYLLKILKDSKGKASYSEIKEYLEENVTIKALKLHNMDQNPTVQTSPSLKNWEGWKFR